MSAQYRPDKAGTAATCFVLALVLAVLGFISAKAHAADVVLEWDAPADTTGVEEYVIYLDATEVGRVPSAVLLYPLTVPDGVVSELSVSSANISSESPRSAPVLWPPAVTSPPVNVRVSTTTTTTSTITVTVP